MSKELRQACAAGKFEIVKQLIIAGADVNAVGPSTGKGPLHRAVEYGHLNIAEFLMDNGADPKAKDANGNTPLHLICMSAAKLEDTVMAKWIATILYKPFELFRQEKPDTHCAGWGPREMLSLAQDLFQANNEGNAPLTLFSHMNKLSDDKPIAYHLLKDATIKQQSTRSRVMLFVPPCTSHQQQSADDSKLKCGIK